MRIALTGATGFLGKHIVDYALKEGHFLKILIRRSIKDLKYLNHPMIEHFFGDIDDPNIHQEFLSNCDYLIHTAAINVPFNTQKEMIYKTNFESSIKLMLKAQQTGIKKIIFTGSASTYGPLSPGQIVDETMDFRLWQASNHYEKSKFLCKKKALQLFKEKKLPIVILDPSTCIGPNDIRPTYCGKLIIDIINQKLPGYFNIRHNYVDIREVAKAHITALKKGRPGESYILCNDKNILISDFFKTICDLTGKKMPWPKLPLWSVFPLAYLFKLIESLLKKEPIIRLSTVRRAKLDIHLTNQKAKKELDFRPGPYEQALEEEIEWFYQNGYLLKL